MSKRKTSFPLLINLWFLGDLWIERWGQGNSNCLVEVVKEQSEFVIWFYGLHVIYTPASRREKCICK